jgi:Raf kinase inhibitor-like YbhB/YbcL family protein
VSIFWIGRRTWCTPTRVVNALAVALLLGGCGSSGSTPQNQPLPIARPAIELSSPAIARGGPIDREFTCDGPGNPPPLRVATVPKRARELALFVTDPDAPGGDFPHWSVYGIPPSATSITPRSGREGRNGFGKPGYGPPCPPKGDKPHRYAFVVYALKTPIGLPAGASPDEVLTAIRSKAIASGTLVATYGR